MDSWATDNQALKTRAKGPTLPYLAANTWVSLTVFGGRQLGPGANWL